MMEVLVEIDEKSADSFFKLLENSAVKKYKVLKPIEFVDDDEQKEIEGILNSLTKEDKEIASSKKVTIEI